MSPIEIIALVFALAVLIKGVTFLILGKKMVKYAEKMIKQTSVLMVVFLVFLIVIGYYVISALGIIPVVAAVFFGHALIGLMFVQFPKVYTMMAKKFFNDRPRLWLLFLPWIILAVWVLIELFL